MGENMTEFLARVQLFLEILDDWVDLPEGVQMSKDEWVSIPEMIEEVRRVRQ